jgi:hypothetical protein
MKIRVRAVPRGFGTSSQAERCSNLGLSHAALSPLSLPDAAAPSQTPSAGDLRPQCWPCTPSAVLSWHACLPIAPESGRMQPAAGTRRLNRCAGCYQARGGESAGLAPARWRTKQRIPRPRSGRPVLPTSLPMSDRSSSDFPCQPAVHGMWRHGLIGMDARFTSVRSLVRAQSCPPSFSLEAVAQPRIWAAVQRSYYSPVRLCHSL